MAWANALRITCQNCSPKLDKLSCENRILCRSPRYLNFVLPIANTPYLLTDDELGDDDDIDCFVMPHGMFTRSVSAIHSAELSDFRIDSSMDITPYVALFCWAWVFSTSTPIQIKQRLQMRCRLRSAAAKFGVQMFPDGCENAF